jgi:hypothetical protein
LSDQLSPAAAEIRELIEPFDGDYDGWGALIVKRES